MAQNVNENGRDAPDRRSGGRKNTSRRNADQENRGEAKAEETTKRDAAREEAALQARLAKLSRALDARRREQAEAESREAALFGESSLGKAISLGFRVMAEFTSAVVVGAIIGWQLDVWLGTKPILLIVFLVLGTAAGFLNVYRLAAGPTGPKHGSN